DYGEKEGKRGMGRHHPGEQPRLKKVEGLMPSSSYGRTFSDDRLLLHYARFLGFIGSSQQILPIQ
ncbi:MAG: hypothetical protein ACXU99_02970, partial [Thermodesulfobacteriota bacterium]